MQRHTLGRTGIAVSRIGLGAMPLSIAGRPAPEDARAVIEAFVRDGGDFIDTANVYCLDDRDIGHNERLIAGALAGLGESAAHVLVATKGGLVRPRGEWVVEATPERLRLSCEQSLRDLGVGTIALYQLHAPDPAIAIERSVEALAQLQAEGRIRHIGLSNVGLRELDAALRIARIESVQNRCNVLRKRDLRNGFVAACAERGVSYIAHSPAGGHHGHGRLAEKPLLRQLGERHDCTPQTIALAWLLASAPSILPIPGASRVASVHASRTAEQVVLEKADIDALNRLPDG